ncbi:unnamed protein product [Gongylonema pulchrum]|uniref:THOC2_N domain-containing protein n=1 Tax=Gongylonema pulchrum TaxID=637853 RepID=A0A183EDJ5_9BILA|nr:unnamed protein product [Gongylonema pulchrum]
MARLGQFNLDPNRVIDIILECFEASLSRRKFFIELLTKFKADSDDICSILGFKFTFYQRSGETPLSLYKVAAVLCDERIVDLLSLSCFLTPKLEELMNDQKSRLERDTKRAKKAEIVSTGAVSASSSAAGAYLDDGAAVAGVSFSAVAALQNAEDSKLADEKDNDVRTLPSSFVTLYTTLILSLGHVMAVMLLTVFPILCC